QLHGRRDVTVQEVQRYLSREAFRLSDALEIDVQHLRLVRVPLHRAQQHATGSLAIQLHFKDGSVELFLTDRVENLVVIEFDAQRLVSAAIDNGRNSAFAAQAAARTRTLVTARSGVK